MKQTEHTAIVLRSVNYKENDRMLTLLSPTRGKIEAMSRGCRKARSPLLNASEMFALGDFEFYEKSGRLVVTNAVLIETFFPLRTDFDRLACGTYCLNVAEALSQPGQNAQELFMLLLHTLSRLTFTDQPWKPMLSGFLLHAASVSGIKPRLNHCVYCGRNVQQEHPVFFDYEEGGLVCSECCRQGNMLLAREQAAWMRLALTRGSAEWVDTEEAFAPWTTIRTYMEKQLNQPIRSGAMLPTE